jgi:aspartate-semialdehyde dehydrogenase
MSDGYKVGVLGATGLVGTTILELLAARDFPVAELRLLASERSAGKTIEWNGQTLTVQEVGDDSIQGLDLVLSSAGGSVSAEWTPKLVEAGATVVDNTSYWRMHDDVPLVVSEVNPEALDGHKGIIANPNCSTMQMVVALKPLYDAAGIERLVISTYQAVSGTEAQIYPHQIAFNVLAQAGSFPDGDDHTDEERKLINETRKILGDPGIRVSATCIRVPVETGHSEAVNVETREPLDPDQARELLAAAPGVTVVDDPAAGRYPMAIDAAGKDDVFVGRIRRDPGNERALDIWVVSDNLRKGAATNTVQLGELLIERDLLGTRH